MSERRSVWLDDAPSEYPPLTGDERCQVVVIGAGIAGLTTALLLRRQGQDVVLVEANRVASGTTGGTTGKVTSQHGLAYAEMVGRHGWEVARSYAELNEQAIGFVESLAIEIGADCDFTRASAFVYDESAEAAEKIEEECEVAVALGLPARLTDDIGVPFPVAVALEFEDQAHFDPVRYCRGMAAEFARLGGRLYEKTRALDLDGSDASVGVSTAQGSISAEQAVVTTLLPVFDRGGFFAKSTPSRAYGIAAVLREPARPGMYLSASEPIRSLRPWLGGGSGGVVVVGENHPTGEDEAVPRRWGDLEEWVNRNFAVESFEYRWSAQDYYTADGLPYIGRSPLDERVSVATGFAKWGMTNGTAAAVLLADTVLGHGEVPEGLAAGRIGDAKAVAELIRINAGVVGDLVKDRVGRLGASDPADLGRGEAGIVKIDGTTVAAYRDPSGALHAVSPSCTHLGCGVKWNDAENSWDCPCHGSRFAIDGAVLAGPAIEPLEKLDL